jgi:hypothetical protein
MPAVVLGKIRRCGFRRVDNPGQKIDCRVFRALYGPPRSGSAPCPSSADGTAPAPTPPPSTGPSAADHAAKRQRHRPGVTAAPSTGLLG